MSEEEVDQLNREIQEMDYMIQLIKKAKEKFLIQLFQKKYLLLCQTKKASSLIQEQYDQVQQLMKESKSLDQYATYSYWVCCNPSQDVQLQDFLGVCKKAMSKIWIEHYCYVIEQRGKTIDEIGKGFHYHALVIPQIGKKHCQIVRELANSFKKMCDTSNYHFFSVKPIPKEEHIRKLKYIVGEKQDDDKIQKQRIDVQFRNIHNIPKCYNSEDFNFEGQYQNII